MTESFQIESAHNINVSNDEKVMKKVIFELLKVWKKLKNMYKS